MSLSNIFKSATKKIDTGYKKYKEEAPARERARIDSLRSKAAREKERAAIQRERLEAKREVTQAKSSLRKAQNDLKSAKGGGFDINSLFRKPVKRAPVRRRRTTAKRTTVKKRR